MGSVHFHLSRYKITRVYVTTLIFVSYECHFHKTYLLNNKYRMAKCEYFCGP